jgi:hypothetical protein
MRKPLLALAALVLASCSHPKTTPLGDIAALGSLEDVMDNQATASDPQFKKIGQAKFDDAELAALAEAATRIQATSLKTKDFAKGRAEFEAFATKVNDKAKALGAGATAKDAAAINAALTEMKATCKECHSKFR